MIIEINDRTENLYNDILELLRDLKVTQGPMAVNSTLSRHKDIKEFLIEYQKSKLTDIQDKMTLDN